MKFYITILFISSCSIAFSQSTKPKVDSAKAKPKIEKINFYPGELKDVRDFFTLQNLFNKRILDIIESRGIVYDPKKDKVEFIEGGLLITLIPEKK